MRIGSMNRLISMGAFLQQSIILQRGLTGFVHDGIHRHVEQLAYMGPSQAALSSPSPTDHFPVPT